MKIIIKHILIVLGIIMFSIFMWYRFIRERLPREIPFNLSIITFVILLYICCVYIYLIMHLIFKIDTTNQIIITIINIIYKPLKTLDESIKTNKIIEYYYKKILIYFINFLKKINTFYNSSKKIDYLHFIYFFEIFPRIILVVALFIDSFYFHSLFLLYKVILFGLLILINKYIMYSFKYAKEQYISQLELMLHSIESNYSEDEDNELADLCNNLIKPRAFINVQTNFIVYEFNTYTYSPVFSNSYKKQYCNINNLPITYRLTKKDYDIISLEFYKIIDIVIPLSVHLEEYLFRREYMRIKNMKIIIFGLYLLSWSYILFVSIHTLPPDFITVLCSIISGMFITIMITFSYTYSYLIIKFNLQLEKKAIKNDSNKD